MKNLDCSLEIYRYFEKIEREMSSIDDRRYEIGRFMNSLEHEDSDLLDRYVQLESAKEICCRALAGEPIAIWAELQRLGF